MRCEATSPEGTEQSVSGGVDPGGEGIPQSGREDRRRGSPDADHAEHRERDECPQHIELQEGLCGPHRNSKGAGDRNEEPDGLLASQCLTAVPNDEHGGDGQRRHPDRPAKSFQRAAEGVVGENAQEDRLQCYLSGRARLRFELFFSIQFHRRRRHPPLRCRL
jgi:hypothetical protein